MKKILILSVNPPGTTRLHLDREVREIQATLKRAKYRDRFEIVSEGAVRVDDLRRALLDYQPAIVHFSGHGVGTEGLVLENDSGQTKLVSSESLAHLFKLFQTKIECVLINACYSEIQARVIHEYIDYLIGMNRPIGDEAAIKFSIGFYDALGAGEPYARCFEIGRASIDLEGIPEAETPQLKARPRAYSLSGIKESEESKEAIAPSPPIALSPPIPQKTTSQAMNFSGGQISNAQIGQAGRDIKQTQQITSGSLEKSLTVAEILELVKQIEQIVISSDLPEKYKQKALNHVETISEEIQEDEPDKDFAVKNLQKLSKVLKEANETAQSGVNIWQKLEPVFTKLAPWLGVAAKSLLLIA
ncbi:CHAT domain-containing protein [Coleofasciculus sp. FACHB-1120]|uniref:CHAT domain-containing protein n=1 Tax=Coleofasciculus sp. FACHB-1120 TaxID=2692783 RepID=UPI00168795F0|nr:CHAT domain-containing protein [Coleofasciculus sp. FACHB-1120]MBD2743795.1 CHAT domain-containing protein [Coleofasciculus sp. FACHB-1120]